MIPPPTAARDSQEKTRRFGEPSHNRISAYGYVRCECRRCRTHLNALAVGDRVLGVCSNCGGTAITALMA